MISQQSDTSKYTEPRFNGYVGMPAALYLDEFGRHLRAMFNTEVYLVGSALTTKDWHDLDVRVILSESSCQMNHFQKWDLASQKIGSTIKNGFPCVWLIPL